MTDYIYDRQGNPITVERWSELFGDKSYQSLAKTELDGILVSTVWLGTDHSFGDGGPLIFETMVFRGDESHEEMQERYRTEAEAFAGHDRIVDLVKEQLRTGRYK